LLYAICVDFDPIQGYTFCIELARRAAVFRAKSRATPMVIPNPKAGLRASEVLLTSVAELLADASGQLTDHGVHDLALLAQDIGVKLGGLQTAVRVRLSEVQ
jgi:hypothetical protein